MPQEFLDSITKYLPVLVLLVVCTLILIIPQKRREKKVKAMLEGIKVGDSVKTIGGIYGKVAKIKEDLLTITTGPDKVAITISKSAVASVEDSDVTNEVLK